MGCCCSNPNLCPAPGDSENNLLSKLLQAVIAGGGSGGGGVTGLSVNGGPFQTGNVSISTGGTVTSVNGDPGPAVVLDTDDIGEGVVNFYFTEARVLGTDLAGFASALGAITAADTVLSAFGKTQGRLAALEAGTAGPFLLRAGDTGTGAFLFTPSANDVVPLTLTTTAGSLTTSNNLVVNYGASNLLTLRNDGRLVLNGRIAAITTDSLGHGLRVLDTNTAAAAVALTIAHNTTTAGASGIGAIFDWNLHSTTTSDTRAARWTVLWTDATHATRTSTTSFTNFTSGTESIQLQLGAGQVQGTDGTLALPTFTSRNDANTGMYFPAADTIGISVGGVNGSTTKAAAFGAGPSITPSANLDVNNGTTATLSYFYRTTDGLASPVNYARLAIDTAASATNTLLRTQAAGTGLTAGQPRILQVGTGPSTGTDITGNSVIIHSGQSTGTGLRGAILFQQSIPASTGSSVNALATPVSINTAGVLVVGDGSTVSSASPSGIILNQLIGTGVDANCIRLSSTASTCGMVAGTVGSFASANGPNFALRGNTFSGSANQRGNMYYVAGNPTTPGTAEGSINFLTGADVTRLIINKDGLFQFFGQTSSFPALKRSSAELQVRLADDSAFAGISTGYHTMAVGAPLSVTSGANQRAGNATLVAGTVTVANTSVTANTIVLLTRKTSGGTIGLAITYTVTAATSFTITSDSAIDTSTFSYFLIEVP